MLLERREQIKNEEKTIKRMTILVVDDSKDVREIVQGSEEEER